ncbi:ABC transporter permease [Mobilitalea sibirica]|uniref:ABC transporter permease n=1 Tax=Mobilitalea sibirica TaxID=1462919 RepID=A0A8J7H4J2_9FIRM|nr:ABC transporter permease [Mobilitalea sibirica]MBH1942330.1 ABC transporter permease [Mobilitalea sibirica]
MRTRLRSLIIGDIQFQFKYGFYFVYTVFTFFYICLLFAFPATIREKAAILMIYSDPAAMGLFFMGSIVLFEKSQRVLNSIAVSPVKVSEYILSKVVSLGLIGTVVGVLIAFAAGNRNIILVIIATFMGSVIFSLFGLMIASKIQTLNQFMVATIPFEILCLVPSIFYLFGYQKPFMLLHPGIIVIRMMEGKNIENIAFELLMLGIWILMIYMVTYRIVKKMFQSVGGVKL